MRERERDMSIANGDFEGEGLRKSSTNKARSVLRGEKHTKRAKL